MAVFLGVLTLFLFDFFFFVILFGGCCFVCTFAYKKGLGGPVTRRLETVQASAGYQDLSFIIPKTTGFGFSKRWVSFHKTTPILFEGFSHPSFFSLWGLSPLRALSPKFTLASLWVLSRRFCSFRFCVSLVLAAFSLVFPLFGGWTLLFS